LYHYSHSTIHLLSPCMDMSILLVFYAEVS